MVIVTRGPIHIIAEIEDTSPMQIIAATMRPADVAEDVAATDGGDVELAGELVDRGGVQEHRVQRDIDHEHDQRPRQVAPAAGSAWRRASRR